MAIIKKIPGKYFMLLFILFLISNLTAISAEAASINKKVITPKKIAIPKPVISGLNTEYNLGDTVNIDVSSAGYIMNVKYRVVVIDNSTKKNYEVTKGYTKSVSSKKMQVFKYITSRAGKFTAMVYAIGAVEKTLTPAFVKKTFTVYNGTSLKKANTSFNSKTVNGDLYIGANNIKVTNVIVKGTIFINPGKDGTTILNKVTAANIKILSGGENSIHFNGVTANKLYVDSSSKVRVVSGEETKIGSTTVTSYAVLDEQGGMLGTVTIGTSDKGTPVVMFKGTFTEPVIVESSAIISTVDEEESKTQIPDIQISPILSNSEVTLKGNFQDVHIDKSSKLYLGSNTEIAQLTINSESTIKINDSANIAKMEIDIRNKDALVSIDGSKIGIVHVSSEANILLKENTNINMNIESQNVNVIAEDGAKAYIDTNNNKITTSGNGTITTRETTDLSNKEADKLQGQQEELDTKTKADKEAADKIAAEEEVQKKTDDQIQKHPSEPAQAAPIASNVAISGTAQVGQTLTGNYTYSDLNNDLEGVTTFRWLANTGAGDTYEAIPGATSKTYVIDSSMLGKTIKFEVTPVAQSGITTGSVVGSAATTQVVPAEAAPIASNVAISGTAQVGQTLTGGYDYSDVNNDLEGTTTFRWLANTGVGGTYEAISGATSKTYVIDKGLLGKTIKFEVIPVAQSGNTTGSAVESKATVSVVPAEAAPIASNVAISGTVQVGKTLIGSYIYSDVNNDLEGATTFRWLANTGASGIYEAISGATSKTYVIDSGLQGKTIKFEIIPVAQSGNTTGSAVESKASEPVVPAEAAPIASNVSISGTAQVGQTLTGSYIYSDVNNDLEGVTIFRWLANTGVGGAYEAISGATSNTYMIDSGLLGKKIKFEVIPVAHSGITTGSVVQSTATATVVPAEAAPIASNVSISGTAQVGQTLTGSYLYSDVNNDLEGATTFRWLANTGAGGAYEAISGATSNTYVIDSGLLGKTIKFEIIPVAQSGNTTGSAVESKASVSVVPAEAAPIASNVSISGTAQVGQTLTGSYLYSDVNNDLEGVTTFRWLANTEVGGAYEAIPGATSKTYVIDSRLQGKAIKFEVTPVALSGNKNGIAVASAATVPIVPAEAAPIASNVTISGTAQVGQTLTGSYSYSDVNNDLEGTTTFRWLANTGVGGTYAAIPGATSKTYVIDSGLLGKTIKFEVTPLSWSGNKNGIAVVSTATAPVVPAEAAPIASNVTISGTVQIGQILTGSYTYSDVNNDLEGATTFRWLANTGAGSSYVAIPGATSKTYVIDSGLLGKTIKFEVTPVAQSGNKNGIAAVSTATGAILPSIQSLSVTQNGLITISFAVKPETAPLAGDFSVIYNINEAGDNQLGISGFSYDGDKTVTFTYTPFAKSISTQNINITVAFKSTVRASSVLSISPEILYAGLLLSTSATPVPYSIVNNNYYLDLSEYNTSVSILDFCITAAETGKIKMTFMGNTKSFNLTANTMKSIKVLTDFGLPDNPPEGASIASSVGMFGSNMTINCQYIVGTTTIVSFKINIKLR